MRKFGLWTAAVGMFLCLMVSVFFLRVFFFGWPESDQLDPEYPVFTATDEVITKTYSIENCNDLWFFSADHRTGNKLTKFCNAIPNVTVINSDSSYVELTTNKSVHDAISISDSNGVLDIDMQDSCYQPVYQDDPSYDYDSGTYLDCTQFEITVYGRFNRFQTDAELVLDFEAAKADQTNMHFSFQGVSANIHHIDTKKFNLICSGTSELTVSGSATGQSNIMLFHNTHVQANDLKADLLDLSVSGESSFEQNGTIQKGSPDVFLIVMRIVFSVVCLVLLCLNVWFVCKFCLQYSGRVKESKEPSQ